MSHWFFLSYARDDNKDGYVKKFYEDLRRAVAGKTGTINENEAGFFDGEAIEPGTKWSQELGDALQQSRCFISVFSPTYFQKKFCGKEWSVFDERQAAYAATLAAGAPTPNLMIPILWEKKKYVEPVIPSALSAIQFNHDDFGDKYTEYGLRQMMKLNKFRDAYESFIDVFSDKLIDTARTQRVRVSQSLTAIAVFLVLAMIQHGEVMLGLIDERESWLLTGFTLLGAIVFYALIRSGANLRLGVDPSLTLPQCVFACTSVAVSYGITGAARGSLMCLLILVLMFGMFALTPTQARRLAVYAVTLLSIVMFWKSRTDPLRYPAAVELVHFVFAAEINGRLIRVYRPS